MSPTIQIVTRRERIVGGIDLTPKKTIGMSILQTIQGPAPVGLRVQSPYVLLHFQLASFLQ